MQLLQLSNDRRASRRSGLTDDKSLCLEILFSNSFSHWLMPAPPRQLGRTITSAVQRRRTRKLFAESAITNDYDIRQRQLQRMVTCAAQIRVTE
jgi:hypothetical protein